MQGKRGVKGHSSDGRIIRVASSKRRHCCMIVYIVLTSAQSRHTTYGGHYYLLFTFDGFMNVIILNALFLQGFTGFVKGIYFSINTPWTYPIIEEETQ